LKIVHTKYKAIGFVETLIAIMVAGVACIALMGLAANTISIVATNEREDQMTQIAIEGASAVSAIALQNNTSELPVFPKISNNVGNCFQLSTNSSSPSFETNESGGFKIACNYDNGGRDDCKGSLASGSTDIFEVFCITSASDITSGIVVGKVVVGKTVCVSSGACDISDYQYYSLNKTLQR
jgi:hypothetical protein